MGVSQRAIDTRGRSREGRVGGAYRASVNDQIRTGINKNPQAVQITTVTMTDQGDDDDVIITIQGVDITYNTGTGKSLATIGAEFAAAINENGTAGGVCTASFSTSTLTLTGNWPGQTFTVSIANDPDSVLSAVTTTQSAAEAEAIPFGRGIITQGRDSGEDCELVALAKSSLLTPQVETISVTYVASNLLVCQVYRVDGGREELIGTGSTVAATDRDTTIDALIASINADLPANTVVVTADNASATALVFTAEIAGLEFRAEIFRSGGGASAPVITKTNTTGPDETTSIHRALRGFSVSADNAASSTIGGGEGEYAGNAGVVYCKKGERWFESSETIGNDAEAYIELGVTADNGQLFASGSATRVKLDPDRVRFIRDGRTSTDSLAAVHIDL